jgi:diadenosine tetraphosphate (Ap4A) HIT family hydrolase
MPHDRSLTRTDCPFCRTCDKDVVLSNDHAIAVADGFPISPGHTLVVPRSHAPSLFDLSPEVQAGVWRLVAEARDWLKKQVGAESFNVGINDGAAAGQTVSHAHIHVIPRFPQDVRDPRGGVRWVIPTKAAYWTESP